MKKHILTCFGITAALTACSGDIVEPPPPPPPANEFTVSFRGDSLWLNNQTVRPVHFTLASTPAFSKIAHLVCAGPSCPSIPPGGADTLLISETTPTAFFAGLYLHWWHGFRTPGGTFRPDSVRTGQIF